LITKLQNHKSLLFSIFLFYVILFQNLLLHLTIPIARYRSRVVRPIRSSFHCLSNKKSSYVSIFQLLYKHAKRIKNYIVVVFASASRQEKKSIIKKEKTLIERERTCHGDTRRKRAV